MTALAQVGHNSARPAELVRDLDAELRTFVQEHPVLQDDVEARAAAALAQRAKNLLADLDDERKAKTGPLNEKVKAINAEYAEATSPLSSGLIVLKGRITTYTIAEEERRQEAAETARLEALAKAAAANEALRRAQEAEDNAAQGETADVVSLAQEAVRASNEARKAGRDFLRAEREANSSVKLATGFGRATSARNHEVLTVTDPVAAIAETGLTEDIAEAILKSARAYRKLHNRLPAGIATRTERAV